MASIPVRENFECEQIEQVKQVEQRSVFFVNSSLFCSIKKFNLLNYCRLRAAAVMIQTNRLIEGNDRWTNLKSLTATITDISWQIKIKGSR